MAILYSPRPPPDGREPPRGVHQKPGGRGAPEPPPHHQRAECHASVAGTPHLRMRRAGSEEDRCQMRQE